MQERRNKGQRRWGLETGFPLRDSNGITVISNRRQTADRRLDEMSLADRLMLFSEMPLLDPERKRNC